MAKTGKKENFLISPSCFNIFTEM
uniref:Uncharacterized protein n=1 Tax=Arundo donax TaxID=35708 RepID=A0A0A9FWL4_ARUDO